MKTSPYKYEAVDAKGVSSTGQVVADSENEALRILKRKNLTPIKITQSSQKVFTFSKQKVAAKDIIDFTNGLSTLVQSRVPIDRSLTLLEGITESIAMRGLVSNLRREVKEGRALASAMENYPLVFNKMYVNIIRAGEEGGILETLLPSLERNLEASARTRDTVISALIYPAVLLVTGILSVGLLLVFVVPQFAMMFQDSGANIPNSALFLLSASGFIKTYGIFIPVCIFLFWVLLRRINDDPLRKRRKDEILIQLPIGGKFFLYKECAVFSRTLGFLLDAGIPLIRSLRISREVVENAFLRELLVRVEEDVRAGMSLGLALDKAKGFPILLHQLVTVGEESGQTSTILIKSASTFDTIVSNQLSRLVAALQPALILILAVAVGGITITMLSAVFSMNAVEF
ncbi:type II secretion system F family protein [Gammaproteobacteria bacterium]|nr:type II secretion system F family protein [Gammaproteobacteria bacterium]MDB2444461.1 type II secretion system F family protein [Gammaproteobacteria bacterium]